MLKKIKTPWSTKAVMQQIYDQHLWGGNHFDFYSGEGSHDSKITKPYIDSVINFLISHKNNLTICDFGCGDFNIGKQLTKYTKKYIAIDIVEPLIKRNKDVFDENNLEFYCLDVSKDKLPIADCIIIRQVFQHLSNEEIKLILDKISTYKYLILTEHLPSGNFKANKNKIASQGIRLKHNSGIILTEAPFNLLVKSSKIINEVILDANKGQITTILYSLA